MGRAGNFAHDLRAAAAAILVLASVSLLAWGLWPSSRVLRILQLGPLGLTPPTSVPNSEHPAIDVPLTIPETRSLILDYPATVRAGDRAAIRLSLEVGADPPTPTIINEEGVKSPSPLAPSSGPEFHNVIAEAYIDLPGVDVRPSQAVIEPMPKGADVNFIWSVRPAAAQDYQGTTWLFLVFVDQATQAHDRVATSAQTIQIKGTTLFGLSGEAARAWGGLGLIAGIVLGLRFSDGALRWLLKTRRSRS